MNGSRFKSVYKIHIGFLALLLMAACVNEDDTNDADAQITHTNTMEFNKLSGILINPDEPLKFALLSDIHSNYDLLSKAIDSISSESDIEFIICCGDLTDLGSKTQFESFVNTIERSSCPVFSVVGNHDYLSYGSIMASGIFGQLNFSFVIGEYEFILFDNVVWGLFDKPDFKWLATEVSDNNHKHVVASHYPPWESENSSEFRNTVNSENTILCLHGHTHSYANTYYNNVHTLVSTALIEHEYYVISLSGTTSDFETVHF